jgi:hypothetical protein
MFTHSTTLESGLLPMPKQVHGIKPTPNAKGFFFKMVKFKFKFVVFWIGFIPKDFQLIKN